VLAGATCSKDARVAGIVVDVATERGVKGIEIWATCDNLGKKVVAKSGNGGGYSLALPAGEWQITLNPEQAATRSSAYFAGSGSLRVYEKEKKDLDTSWLLPCPPDSATRTGYLLCIGEGYHVVHENSGWGSLYGVCYSECPSFPETRRPFAMLFFAPKVKRTTSVELYSTLPSIEEQTTINGVPLYCDIPSSWWELPQGEEVPVTVAKSGSWHVVLLPENLPPNKYFMDYIGHARYLFEVRGISLDR